jgi:hypothetical protein
MVSINGMKNGFHGDIQKTTGAAKDWLASRLTVDTFLETFTASSWLSVEQQLTRG